MRKYFKSNFDRILVLLILVTIFSISPLVQSATIVSEHFKGGDGRFSNISAGRIEGPTYGNHSGNVNGDVTGDVIGDIIGDVIGDVTGDITGDVVGDVTGDLTGNVTGIVNGNEINANLFANLSTAVNAASTVGKTVVVTSAVTCPNITVPSNRAIKVIYGGSINQTGTCAIGGPFSTPNSQVFTGTGALVFGKHLIAPAVQLWAGTTTVSLPAGQVVYPEWWGKSDTDDGPFIQLAVNSLISGGLSYSGGTIMLTANTYTINTQVTIGGKGVHDHILITSSRSPIYSGRIINGTTIGTTPLFYVTGCGIKFDHINITGTLADTVGIKVGAGTDATINPDEFTFTNGVIASCKTGIELNSRNFIIRDNLFAANYDSIAIPGLEGSTPYTYLDRRDYFIERNNFHVCTGTAILLTGTKSHSEVIIRDNMFKQVQNGISGSIEDSIVSGNLFNNIIGTAINITTNAGYSGAYGVTVSNNQVSGYQGAGGNSGDAIKVVTPFPTVSNNRVTRKTGNGIVVTSDNAVITGNAVHKCTLGGIVVTGSKATISGNLVMDNDYLDASTYSGISVTGDRANISGNVAGNSTGTPGSGVGGQIYGINIISGISNMIGVNTLCFNKTAQTADAGTNTTGVVGEGWSRRITYGTAAPAAGTWSVGDRVINRASASGQPKSWVCTVAGTPGTWVSEGNL